MLIFDDTHKGDITFLVYESVQNPSVVSEDQMQTTDRILHKSSFESAQHHNRLSLKA